VALVLLLSTADRAWHIFGMYNDQPMMLYLLISVYNFAKNRPIMGSIWFTMSLSVKAGVLLMLPSLLGQIQYNHGTLKLIICIAIILGF